MKKVDVICWHCGCMLEDSGPVRGKLPFRALCDQCGSWQHCCRNCQHYREGLPNNCAVPETEWVADREGFNFCEEFHLREKELEKKGDPQEVCRRLFGDLDVEGKE